MKMLRLRGMLINPLAIISVERQRQSDGLPEDKVLLTFGYGSAVTYVDAGPEDYPGQATLDEVFERLAQDIDERLPSV